jgi:hypothetical protein
MKKLFILDIPDQCVEIEGIAIDFKAKSESKYNPVRSYYENYVEYEEVRFPVELDYENRYEYINELLK